MRWKLSIAVVVVVEVGCSAGARQAIERLVAVSCTLVRTVAVADAVVSIQFIRRPRVCRRRKPTMAT
jgi:hypothetical protein